METACCQLATAFAQPSAACGDAVVHARLAAARRTWTPRSSRLPTARRSSWLGGGASFLQARAVSTSASSSAAAPASCSSLFGQLADVSSIAQAADATTKLLPQQLRDTMSGVASTAQSVASTAQSYSPFPLLPPELAQQASAALQIFIDMPDWQQATAAIVTLLTAFYLTMRPGILAGALDCYVLTPIDYALDVILNRRYKRTDFLLGSRLGEGSFGIVYEGAKPKKKTELAELNATVAAGYGKRQPQLRDVEDLSQYQRVILKKMKVGEDSAEHGDVEDYICRRMRRSCPNAAAQYLGTFFADATIGAFAQGGRWLVWSFEGKGTLADYMKDPYFPDNLEMLLFGKQLSGDETTRLALVTKKAMRQVFRALADMHRTGIVHRDVKPLHFVVTSNGKLKLIDFGAAADLRVGKNYVPDRGVLDPDYCPPEQLIMPQETPSPPSEFLTALLSPFIWQLNHPDRFDTYSAGIMLLQMALPQLRSMNGLKMFNRDIARYNWNLKEWRARCAHRYNFDVLDMDFGAGWDLACKLVCRRGPLRRGRLSASQALRHRYFLLRSDTVTSMLTKINMG
eukprot:jgi/Chlat1/7848/Chrsp66S07296